MTAQMRSSGWRPGVAHREMRVASFLTKGVDPKTTGGEVRHGLESRWVAWVLLVHPGCPRGRRLDSHHLRGAECSKWALSTLGLGYLKFQTRLDISTRGIELLLLLEIIANHSGVSQPNLLQDILVPILLSSSPGDGVDVAMAWKLPNSCLAVNSSQAHTRNPRGPLLPSCLQEGSGLVSGVDVVASMGDGILALENDRVGTSRAGLAARLAPPKSARGGKDTPGNFQILRFLNRFSTRHSEDHFTPQTGRVDSKWRFGLKQVSPAYGFDVGNGGDSISAFLGPFLGFRPY